MKAIAIDPGSKLSGVVVLDTDTNEVLHADNIEGVEPLLAWLQATSYDALYVERVESMGLGLSYALRDTIELVGVLMHGFGAKPVTRREVLKHLGIAPGTKSKDRVVKGCLEVLWGAGSFERGKLCPRRNRKDHPPSPAENLMGVRYDTIHVAGCDVCNGTGYERVPGPLSHVKKHAIQALGVAVTGAGLR